MFRQVTFPNPDDAPAGAAQSLVHHPVTGFVASQFLFPEDAIVCRLGRVLGTSMPENVS